MDGQAHIVDRQLSPKAGDVVELDLSIRQNTLIKAGSERTTGRSIGVAVAPLKFKPVLSQQLQADPTRSGLSPHHGVFERDNLSGPQILGGDDFSRAPLI